MPRKKKPDPTPEPERRRKLTAKQERFVQAYLIDPNAAAAYRAAGYKARSDKVASVCGAQLLANPSIWAAIEAARAKRRKKMGLTARRVLKGLLAEATNKGKGSSPAARVAAWKLIGMHLGMFPRRVHLSGPGGGPIPHSVEEMSDEQLARIISGSQGGRAGAPPAAEGPPLS